MPLDACEEAFEEPARLDVGIHHVRLEQAVRVYLDRPEALHTAAEMGEQIIHLVRCADRLRLETARLLAVFASTGEAEAQGSNDIVDWVRHNTKISVAESLSLNAVADHYGALPESADAVRSGDIGFGHMVHIARNKSFSARIKRGGFDETPLVERACAESVSRFRRTCLNFRHIQDSEGVKDSEVSAVECRSLSANETDDGRYFINVELDPLAYVEAMTAIDARSVRCGRDDHRNRARRRADGFIEMCMDDMAAKAKPAESLSPVHIAVTCSMDTYLNQPRSPAAETEYGTMLSGAAVGRLSCDASITQILLDGKLIPVGVSKMKRRLSKPEMRALRQKYPSCARPRCSRPASQCEAHHITWWSRGGKSQIEDMCMLCPFHHWQIHEGGWQMGRRDDGGFMWIPPQYSRGPTELVAA
ncbi:MAG: DUF222 domain-containing protein [Candidatus Dormibacteria bacterium]